MRALAQNLSLGLAAGCIGAGAKLLCVWLFARFDLQHYLGLSIQVTPGLQASLVHLMLGGFWGLLLCLPWLAGRGFFLRGLVFGLLVTLWEGMVTFLPSHNVLLGPRFEWRLVLTVLLFNLIWGQVSAAWYRYVR